MIVNFTTRQKLYLFVSFLLPSLLLSSYTYLETKESYPKENTVQIAQSIWRTITSTPGGFTVLMPGEPLRRWQSVPTSAGEANFFGYLVVRPQEETRYYMAYSYFPHSLEEVSIDEVFDEILEAIQPRIEGNLKPPSISQDNVEFDDFVANQYILEYENNYTAIYRLYLIDKRIYQQAVFTKKAEHLPQSIEGFFGSFETID